MQEVILAKDFQVLCGNKGLNHSSLEVFAVAMIEVYPEMLM
jgi:hypothetical protein